MNKNKTKIRPMSKQEYDVWLPHCTNEFANEKSQANGLSHDEAMKLLVEFFQNNLPKGLETPDSHLFSILSEGEQVIGTIWFVISTKWGVTSAFIYDLEIVKTHRRRGHAEDAMSLVEPIAKELGATKLALHVFGFNKGAASLYKKLGYITTDLSMAKPL